MIVVRIEIMARHGTNWHEKEGNWQNELWGASTNVNFFLPFSFQFVPFVDWTATFKNSSILALWPVDIFRTGCRVFVDGSFCWVGAGEGEEVVWHVSFSLDVLVCICVDTSSPLVLEGTDFGTILIEDGLLLLLLELPPVWSLLCRLDDPRARDSIIWAFFWVKRRRRRT